MYWCIAVDKFTQVNPPYTLQSVDEKQFHLINNTFCRQIEKIRA